MENTVLSLVLAVIGYSLLNLGQATQKIGLARARRRRLQGWAVWAVGTLGTSVSVFVVLRAVSIGSLSLVGAMSGTGLISLTLFSALVMGEEVGPLDLVGIGVIVAASSLLGALGGGDGGGSPRIGVLFVYLGVVALLGAGLWAVVGRRQGLAGMVIGGFAGALGGFGPVFQKVSASPAAKSLSLAESMPLVDSGGAQGSESASCLRWLMDVLLNPYALVWILLSLISMVVLQFSYSRGRAIQVIPAFSVCFLVIPVIGGVIGFGERLHPLQWVGVVVVLGGVALLTVRRAPAPA